MELPPKDWLEKMYPEVGWRNVTNSFFVHAWYAYTLSFEQILSEWSGGVYRSVRPGSGQPLASMLRTLTWAQERAEAKQAELIGMTAVAELDDGVFSRFDSGPKAAFDMETKLAQEA